MLNHDHPQSINPLICNTLRFTDQQANQYLLAVEGLQIARDTYSNKALSLNLRREASASIQAYHLIKNSIVKEARKNVQH